MIQNIRKLKSNKFAQFLLCNLIYSGSTFLFNTLFPFVLDAKIFDQLIYLFQMNLFLVLLSGFGLTTGLLKFNSSEENKGNNSLYFFGTGSLIQIILFFSGFFPQNYLSQFLRISDLPIEVHLVFYLSVISTNLFLMNRAWLNLQGSFLLMLKTVSAITVIRLLFLGLLKNVYSNSVFYSLLLLFVLPFLTELFHFYRGFVIASHQSKKYSLSEYFRFISFCLQVFISGALFMMCDRVLLIQLKKDQSAFTSTLGFAYGFIGVITVFNMSFSNYFLGKLNTKMRKDLIDFREKISSYKVHYFLITIAIVILTLAAMYLVYPLKNHLLLAVVAILILKTATVSFLGFTNILSKTLHIQHYDLIINACRLLLVYILVGYSKELSFVEILISTSLVMILGELVLYKIVLKRLSKFTS